MANYGRSLNIPVVVKNIIIINVIMVLLQFVLWRMGIDLDDYLALHYFTAPHFKWWQLFTHMFMHGSPNDVSGTIAHIFFNMYGLFMFGSILEDVWGPKRFLTFYIVCGIGAGLCHLGVTGLEHASLANEIAQYQQHPTLQGFSNFLQGHGLQVSGDLISNWSADPSCTPCITKSVSLVNEYYNEVMDVPMVGASGAIFGVLFAFGYLFPRTELFIMFIPIPIQAKWAVMGYAAIELFSGLGRFRGDNIAHFAHLGGMLFAFILLKIWQRNRINFN